MRMEFRRLTGRVLWSRELAQDGVPGVDLKARAKEALMSFYEGVGEELWPKAGPDQPPEEVAIRDPYGKLLAAYDICNMAADSKRRVKGRTAG